MFSKLFYIFCLDFILASVCALVADDFVVFMAASKCLLNTRELSSQTFKPRKTKQIHSKNSCTHSSFYIHTTGCSLCWYRLSALHFFLFELSLSLSLLLSFCLRVAFSLNIAIKSTNKLAQIIKYVGVYTPTYKCVYTPTFMHMHL